MLLTSNDSHNIARHLHEVERTNAAGKENKLNSASNPDWDIN